MDTITPRPYRAWISWILWSYQAQRLRVAIAWCDCGPWTACSLALDYLFTISIDTRLYFAQIPLIITVSIWFMGCASSLVSVSAPEPGKPIQVDDVKTARVIGTCAFNRKLDKDPYNKTVTVKVGWSSEYVFWSRNRNAQGCTSFNLVFSFLLPLLSR